MPLARNSLVIQLPRKPSAPVTTIPESREEWSGWVFIPRTISVTCDAKASRENHKHFIDFKRKLVTSHDAFQYFARDFGFKIYAIEGVSADDQPSSKKVTTLIKTIRSEGVKAVFFESIENPKVVGEITKETGAKVGGALYADGLRDKEASTYPEMIRMRSAEKGTKTSFACYSLLWRADQIPAQLKCPPAQ
jgi:Zinc-uptake complex component A periplasmic